MVRGLGRLTFETRWLIGLHDVAWAVAKDRMKEPLAGQIVLEPPLWFRKTKGANESHVVEWYKGLKADPETEMVPTNSDSGTESEEEEEEEPEKPKAPKVSVAA